MRKREYLILPFLLLLLFLQFAPYMATKQFGDTVILHAELYDPRDVFRGDYVALNFTQERVSLEQLDHSEDEMRKLYMQKLYAVMSQKNGEWIVKDVTPDKPSDGIYIECVLDYIDEYEDMVQLDFGIERYYVQENTGGSIEDAAREDRLKSVMKVWNGNMVMTDLIME